MNSIKDIIQSCLNRVGYVLNKRTAFTDPGIQLVTALKFFNIDLVVDVGANQGQFSSGLRQLGYIGEIISFEPLPDAHSQLVETAAAHKDWKVHPRCAIGAHDGQIEINVSRNSVSSSILPMLSAHLRAAKDSEYIGSELVKVQKLDSVLPQYISETSRTFIKIDTQGFEWEVVNGAMETLENVQGVLCEVSIIPLYEGQHLWIDIYNRLTALGFTLWAVQRGFTDFSNGRTLQFDAIFFRN